GRAREAGGVRGGLDSPPRLLARVLLDKWGPWGGVLVPPHRPGDPRLRSEAVLGLRVQDVRGERQEGGRMVVGLEGPVRGAVQAGAVEGRAVPQARAG